MMKSGSLAKSDSLGAKSRSLSTILESPSSARRDGGGGSRRRQFWIKIIGAIVAVVAVAIALPVYFATRPATVPVVETMAEETLPSLIKVALIENTGGAILIEYTQLLQDDSTVFYYVTTQDFNATSLAANVSFDGVYVKDPDYLALYLTRSEEPTLEDLSMTFQAPNLRGNVSDKALRIGLLSSVDFPIRLPDTFFPGDFNGAILVHEQRSEETGNSFVAVAKASFRVIVDPEKNIGGGSSPTVTPTTSQPTTKPTKSPTMPPSTASPTSRAPVSPPPSSKKPTEFPTPALRGPTIAPPVPANIILSPVPANIIPNISIDRTNSISESLQTPTEPVPTTRPPTSSLVTAQDPTPISTPRLTPVPTNPPVSVPTNLPTLGLTSVPTSSPSPVPTNLPTPGPTTAPKNSPSPVPTNLPTSEPTMVTTNPSISDSLPILTSELSGSYNIDGTITIDYVQGFENGQVVNRPRLQFDIPNLANAPGPYLYLSKRPYSETHRGDLGDNQDLFIPIDSGEDGQFNVKGRFDQFLDEIDNAQDLEDYANGSWIVWCRPFGVWIGGGEITAS